ncbi:hypothetical protein N7G274_001258 [Stereocaulon virgatum]|uniref:Peptidase M48 domain-containing protein n=1 Tax=Stereocaulon virgatum TaxID=373712 RepID=A0ABR4ARF7_9LECA
MPPRTLFGLLPKSLPVRDFRVVPPPSTRSPLISRLPTRSVSQWGPLSRRQQPRYHRFSRAQQIYNLWHTSPGFRYSVGGMGMAGGVFYYANLERVPVSGRLRFNCVSEKYEEQAAEQQFHMVMQEFRGRVLPPNHPSSRLVNRVLQRLIPASGLEGQQWEVRVIHDPEQKNAFVMPGGKVFVFSGMLPICGGEDGLAAVLGHEIAHQLAHHTGEKLSSYVYLVPLAFLAAYTIDISGQMASFILDLILSRPGSRKMESEADYIGLLLMAEACYDPNAAVGLWQRMAKAEQYAPPQFLSTHPASKNRIARIQEWLPQAQEKQAESQCGSTLGYADEFKRAFQRSDDVVW